MSGGSSRPAWGHVRCKRGARAHSQADLLDSGGSRTSRCTAHPAERQEQGVNRQTRARIGGQTAAQRRRGIYGAIGAGASTCMARLGTDGVVCTGSAEPGRPCHRQSVRTPHSGTDGDESGDPQALAGTESGPADAVLRETAHLRPSAGGTSSSRSTGRVAPPRSRRILGGGTNVGFRGL